MPGKSTHSQNSTKAGPNQAIPHLATPSEGDSPLSLVSEIGRAMDETAEKALSHGVKQGAEAIRIATSVSVQRRLVVEAKEFSLANTLESQNYMVTAHKASRKGTAALNRVDQAAVNNAVDDALVLASFSVPDPYLTMPSATEAPQARPLPFLADPALAVLDLDEMQLMMKEVLALFARDSRLSLDRFELSVTVSRRSLLNSLGVRQAETQTQVAWNWMGMAIANGEVSGMDFDSGALFARASLLPHMLAEAKTFLDRVLKNLAPLPCPTYHGPIVLSPRAVQEILLPVALYHAAGRSVMDGRSKWKEAIETQVTSPLMTWNHHPHHSNLAHATAFDNDGMPTRSLPILERGVLKTHLHDCYTAKRLGAHPTGTAGGPFGLEIGGDSAQFKDLVGSRIEILYVDRFSGNINSITGDFSGVAKNSRLYVNGEEAGSVGETMIAGNVFELLQRVLAVTSQQECVGNEIIAPWVLVDGVTVTGATGAPH